MIRSLALAGLAAVMALSVAPSAAAPPYPQCMTDDGYGRIRPCTGLYKRQHPNWRAGIECMTDDGYGRYRPCSSLYFQGGGPSGQYTPSPYQPNAKKQSPY